MLHLNRALAELGLLSFRERRPSVGAARLAKDAALRLLSPKLRDRAFRAAGMLLPSLIESRARFGAIDLGRTPAFSDELNYFPAVWLNVRGRDPAGTIDPEALDATRRRVSDALRSLRDPVTGREVIAEVTPREALFEGPHVGRAPDLLLTFAPTETGHTWNLMPSRGGGPAFGRLPPDEYLGRKGRSLPGSHRPRGLFVAAGPTVAATGEVEAKIADATATLLARMDVRVPPEAAGRVLWEILAETEAMAPRALPEAPRPEIPAHRAHAVVARLRALGYVE